MDGMPDTTTQRETGMFVYPSSVLRRAFFKAPLVMWRMGLRPLLDPWMLVLTQRGRKSGLPRHTMLEYSIVDGRIYISPGWGTRTRWYQNVLADPHVTVQMDGETFGAVVQQVFDDGELARVYEVVSKRSPVWKPYLDSWGVKDTLSDFLAHKDRIPTLHLEPQRTLPVPPMEADLLWVWPAVAAVGIAAWYFGRERE
jgi:deazaflavin-dependent oxidoreductase (nitroreductase family)